MPIEDSAEEVSNVIKDVVLISPRSKSFISVCKLLVILHIVG